MSEPEATGVEEVGEGIYKRLGTPGTRVRWLQVPVVVGRRYVGALVRQTYFRWGYADDDGESWLEESSDLETWTPCLGVVPGGAQLDG